MEQKESVFDVEEFTKDLFYFPSALSTTLQINCACELVEYKNWFKEAKDNDTSCYTKWQQKDLSHLEQKTTIFALSSQLQRIGEQVGCIFSPQKICCFQFEEGRGGSSFSSQQIGWQLFLILGCNSEISFENEGEIIKKVVKSGDLLLSNTKFKVINIAPTLPHPRLAEYLPSSMLAVNFSCKPEIHEAPSIPSKMYSKFPAAQSGRETKGTQKKSLSNSGFLLLPPDLLLQILSFLPYPMISRCRWVCWHWNLILSLPSSWKQIYLLQYGKTNIPTKTLSSCEELFHVSNSEDKIVFDLGSSRLRIGIAGNDLPKATYANVTWVKNDSKYEMIAPIQKTRVVDIYGLENVLLSSLQSSGLTVTSGILTNHGIHEAVSVREKLMEFSMEKVGAKSFLSQSSQTWQAYTLDTSTMIIDIGYETISFQCICSSYLVPSSAVQLYYGGRHVDQYLYQLLIKEFPELIHFLTISICERWKNEFCENSSAVIKTVNLKQYDISKALHQCGDIFFDPSLIGKNEPSLPDKIISIRNSLDTQTRTDIKMAVFGGGATLPGLVTRIQQKLVSMKQKCNFHTLDNDEKMGGCWMGGSVVGSLSFQFGPSPWITKAEYEEIGSSVIYEKLQF